MTLEYPIMTFSGLSFSNIFSVPKSNISDNDKYMRKLSGFVVLNFRMKKYPINYPILSRTSRRFTGEPYFGRLCAADTARKLVDLSRIGQSSMGYSY